MPLTLIRKFLKILKRLIPVLELIFASGAVMMTPMDGVVDNNNTYATVQVVNS